MTLLGDIALLKRRCSYKIDKNDRLLLSQERLLQALRARLEDYQQETEALNSMRERMYPSGELTRDKLFSVQRSLASVRRKIADINVQRASCEKDLQKGEAEKASILQQKSYLHRKSDKYSHIQDIEKKRLRLASLYMEETETEERITCQK